MEINDYTRTIEDISVIKGYFPSETTGGLKNCNACVHFKNSDSKHYTTSNWLIELASKNNLESLYDLKGMDVNLQVCEYPYVESITKILNPRKFESSDMSNTRLGKLLHKFEGKSK